MNHEVTKKQKYSIMTEDKSKYLNLKLKNGTTILSETKKMVYV